MPTGWSRGVDLEGRGRDRAASRALLERVVGPRACEEIPRTLLSSRAKPRDPRRAVTSPSEPLDSTRRIRGGSLDFARDDNSLDGCEMRSRTQLRQTTLLRRGDRDAITARAAGDDRISGARLEADAP